MIKKKIIYLKEFNIDFSKIKKLILIEENKRKSLLNKVENIVNEEEQIRDNKFFLDTLFSFNISENNLTYLKISFKSNYAIKANTFEKINNFKLLRYLYIENFMFDINFEIKLNNIITLFCIRCKNNSFNCLKFTFSKISISDILF